MNARSESRLLVRSISSTVSNRLLPLSWMNEQSPSDLFVSSHLLIRCSMIASKELNSRPTGM
jgi:hypothetical protein